MWAANSAEPAPARPSNGDALLRVSVFNYTEVMELADEWILLFTQADKHSRSIMPIMRRVARRLERIESPVRVAHMACVDKDLPLCRAFNVIALPTVLFKRRNGETEEYKQKREVDKLLAWTLEQQPAHNADALAEIERKRAAKAAKAKAAKEAKAAQQATAGKETTKDEL